MRGEEGKKEKMLSAIIENAREAVVSVDADGKIIYANKATEELFGWKIEELVGKPMSILAVDAEEQKKQFMEALRKGGARFETVRKARDGSIIPVLMTVVPFKDENGNLIFSSGIMVDVREQKKYESKIEHLNEVLRAIRNVNQLITKEKNEGKLLQKACEILVEVKDYTSVCIFYNGKNYMAGERKECKKALDFIKKRDAGKKEIASYEFSKHYLTVSPIVKNNTRAFLYIIQSKKINKEETGLLKEISGDIAFALDSIDKERKLKEKEILLSHVFESVQDGISILDTDLTIRHVNSAMEKWYEKNMPLVGKKCYEAYHNRKKPCDPCPSLRCMKSGRMERNIVPGLPGSSAEWIELFSHPIRDESGNIMGVVEFVRDITRRKKVEEELKKSEERFRQFFENAPDYCYMISPDGKILNINKSALRALGYRKKEVVGKPLITTLYHPSSQEKAKKIFERWKETGKIRNEELTIVTKKGEERAVLLSVDAVKDTKGNIIHSISIQRDITNIKKTEEALKESEEKFRSLVENARDAIYIITPDGFEYANPAFEKLTGYSSEEILSKDFDFRNLIHPDDVKKIEEREKVGEQGKELPGRYEFRIVTKDGKERIVEARTASVGKGKKVRVIGILRDMTERIKAEEKMRCILEQEKEFKLATAHYFFNPIAIAKGYIDLAMEKASDEEQKENLKAAEHAIERVEKVVKNVTQKGEIRE